MVPFLSALIYFLLLVMSVFLVCLVLIQRGKGGGLAGAFGNGAGGSSAFGSKAGDIFTRVTMICAGIWIALNMVLVILSNSRPSAWGDTPTPGSVNQSPFAPNTEKNSTGQNAAAPPAGAPAGANPFDALTPTNPNAPAPSPLGQGGMPAASTGTAGTETTPATPALPAAPPAPPEAKAEMPPPFATTPAIPASPLPAGSTPSSGGTNPKP